MNRPWRSGLAGLVAACWLALPALATLGRESASILRAVRSADAIVLGRFVSVSSGEAEQHADLEVLSSLRGEVESRLRVRSALTADGRRLPDECYFMAGEKALVLLERSGREWRCLTGTAQAKIPLADPAAEAAALDLMRAYLEATAAGADPARLKQALLGAVAIEDEQLRTGVRFDLARLLTPADLPLLDGLYTDRGRPVSLRAWALASLAGLGVPPPPGLPDLLDPAEPIAVRQAVVQVYGARRSAEDLPVFERALRDPSAEVRGLAVANLQFPEAVSLLGSHFEREPDLEVRLAVVRNLGLIGSPQAREKLRAIRADAREPALRQAAELALAAP
jgi:hypothetical protein